MQEKIIEKSDIKIGVPCKVTLQDSKSEYPTINAKLHSKTKGYKKFADLEKDNIVYVLKEDEHQKLVDTYSELQDATDKVIGMNKDRIADLEQQLQSIKEDTGRTIADLKKEVDDLTPELTDKENIINSYTVRIDTLGNKVDEKNNNVADLEQQLQSIKNKLATSEDKYTRLIKHSDAIADELEKYKSDNKELKNKCNGTDETNRMLNNKIIELSASYEQTSQEFQSILKSKENKLEETVQNHQLHIDEIRQKYQSLLPLKEYVSPKEHSDKIIELKNKINASEKEIAKINADNETKLARLQQELETKHTEDKAQLLVAYNNELHHYKMQYNQLANEYNNLLDDVQSLTRINTLLNGRHNIIKKDKEKVELLELASETTNKIIEYVPKE